MNEKINWLKDFCLSIYESLKRINKCLYKNCCQNETVLTILNRKTIEKCSFSTNNRKIN